MKLTKKYPILGSSANSEQLSESVRGTLILLVPVLIRMFNLDIDENSIIQFIDTGLIFWGGTVALFGLGRKLYFQIIDIYNSFKK